MTIRGGFYDELRPVLSDVRLKDLPRIGNRAVAALDASIWMHKLMSVDPVAVMVLGDSSSTVAVFIDRLLRLHGHGLEVFVVFDGASAPAKLAEDEERRKARKAAAEHLGALVDLQRADAAAVSRW